MKENQMEMVKVESSNVKAIGWEDEVLRVTFEKGGTYDYTGVPELLWKAFKAADSKGKFFHGRIRPLQHKFDYKKVKEDE
jgi:hypothetical protein